MNDCRRCRADQPDTALVCAACAKTLAGDLRALAQLADDGDGETTVAGLAVHGERSKGNGDKPLPVDLRASNRLHAIRNTVTTAARDVAETRGRRVEWHPMLGPRCRTGQRCRHGSCTAIRRPRPSGLAVAAAWLVGQVGWIRHQPDAVETFAELHDAVADMRRLVDGPTPRWWAGPCHETDLEGVRCEQELWARSGARRVGCPQCKFVHDADARRQWLLREAENALAHAGLIAAAVTALGLKVTAAQIRGYAHRGRLTGQGFDTKGRPVYRVGDVIDLVRRPAPVESGAA